MTPDLDSRWDQLVEAVRVGKVWGGRRHSRAAANRNWPMTKRLCFGKPSSCWR